MRIYYLITCLVFSSYNISYSQDDSTDRKRSHHVFLGLGVQKNSFFSGPSIGIGYQYHIQQTYLSAHYNYSEELLIFGGAPQTATELSVLYNWQLSKKKIVSVGAGIAYTSILVDSYNIVGPPPQGSNNPPFQLKKPGLGFPFNINIIIPSKRKFTCGFNLHGIFRKYTNLYDAGFFMSYRIH